MGITPSFSKLAVSPSRSSLDDADGVNHGASLLSLCRTHQGPRVRFSLELGIATRKPRALDLKRIRHLEYAYPSFAMELRQAHTTAYGSAQQVSSVYIRSPAAPDTSIPDLRPATEPP